MLSLEIRKKTGGTEIHRLNGGALTLGASSGNEIVVRARGVAGRHVRIFEKDGGYHLGLYKGVDTVWLNGRQFEGGPISPGDRITIGEATITVVNARLPLRQTPIDELPPTDTATPPSLAPAPTTEVEYRGLRLSAYRLCREGRSAEQIATGLVDLLDREFSPSEWAVGEFSGATFRPLASTFLESPAIPPRMLEQALGGERVVRSESVTGVLTLIVEPSLERSLALGILVRESPRLPARAILLLEEMAQVAGIAAAAVSAPPEPMGARVPVEIAPPAETLSEAELILRETDDLKKITDTVSRQIIDRAMRRVEGNQSRAAEILNISRGSLIAKLKEYQIPDYRYLRRERTRRP
jgi:pSer/pThr/pTyr-binding forkhead associated (FHA) protein